MTEIENKSPCIGCGVNQHEIHEDFCTKAWCPIHYDTSNHGNIYLRQIINCQIEGLDCKSRYRGGIYTYWIMSFNSDSQIADMKKDGMNIPRSWTEKSFMHK